MKGRTIGIRPCPPLTPIAVSASSEIEVQWSGEKTKELDIPPRYLWLKVTITYSAWNPCHHSPIGPWIPGHHPNPNLQHGPEGSFTTTAAAGALSVEVEPQKESQRKLPLVWADCWWEPRFSCRRPRQGHSQLEDAELQEGQPLGTGNKPDAECKQLQVRAVSEIHAVCKVRRLVPVDHGGLPTVTALVLCMGFTSGGYPAAPWSSETVNPKYLLSLEGCLDPPGGQEEKVPSLQVHPRVPPEKNFRDWTIFWTLPFPALICSHVSGASY